MAEYLLKSFLQYYVPFKATGPFKDTMVVHLRKQVALIGLLGGQLVLVIFHKCINIICPMLIKNMHELSDHHMTLFPLQNWVAFMP